jgi:hypothetical protein
MTSIRALCVVVAIGVSNPLEAGEQYTYRLSLVHGVLTFQPPESGTKGHYLFEDDEYISIEFCPRDSEYVCVFSDRYTFAAPKNLKRAGKTWTVNDVTFERLKTGVSVTFFGRRMDDLWLISTPMEATSAGRQAKQPILTLYSPQYGVVGFGFDASHGRSSFFWSTAEKGFGAQK